MNIEKYTERSRGFIQSAQSLAVREGHQQFTPLHILKVLLDDSEGLAGGLIDRSGGNSRAILKATEDALARLPKVSGSGAGQVYLAPETARVSLRMCSWPMLPTPMTPTRTLIVLPPGLSGCTPRAHIDAGTRGCGWRSAAGRRRRTDTGPAARSSGHPVTLRPQARACVRAAAGGALARAVAGRPVSGEGDLCGHLTTAHTVRTLPAWRPTTSR